MGRRRYTLGVVGDGSPPIAAAAQEAAPGFDVEIEPRELESVEQAEGQLREGQLDGAIVDGSELLAESELDSELEQVVQIGTANARTAEALARQGLDQTEREQALNPPPLELSTLEPTAGDEDEREAIAYIATVLLYAQLITYGLWVATGVVEEKSSRVVELLLAAVRPSSLLAGKIIGLGLLGLAQMLLIGVVGVGVALASGALELDPGAAGTIGLVLLWFLLGFAIYASLFGVSGALVSRQEDLQSSTTPLTIFLIVGFFLGLSSLQDPDGGLARVASLVPVSSPLVMPSRMALGEAATWEVLAAVALLLATLAALIPIGARIYRDGILRMGSPVGLRGALRASRG